MAIVTPGFPAKQLITACRSCSVEVNARFGLRRRNRKLIEMKLRQFLRYSILVGIDVWQVGKPIRRSDRELGGIVQSRIEEPAYTSHLERSDKGVPITDRSPRSGPCMLIEPGKTKGIRDQCRSRNVSARHDAVGHLLRIERLAV